MYDKITKSLGSKLLYEIFVLHTSVTNSLISSVAQSGINYFDCKLLRSFVLILLFFFLNTLLKSKKKLFIQLWS